MVASFSMDTVKPCWVTLTSCNALVGMGRSCPVTMKDKAEIPEMMQYGAYSGWDGIIMEGVHHVIIHFGSTCLLSYSLYMSIPWGQSKLDETIHLRSNDQERFHYGMVSERFLTVQSSNHAPERLRTFQGPRKCQQNLRFRRRFRRRSDISMMP